MNAAQLILDRRKLVFGTLGLSGDESAAATTWIEEAARAVGLEPEKLAPQADDAQTVALGLAAADCLVVPHGWAGLDGGPLAKVPSVIHSAIQNGIAVIAWSPGASGASHLIWTGVTTSNETALSDLSVMTQPLTSGFEAFLDSLAPPRSLSGDTTHAESQGELRNFLEARIPGFLLRIEYPLLQLITIGQGLRRTDLLPRYGAPRDLMHPQRPEAFETGAIAARADILANIYAQKFRSSAVGRFALAAIAAVGAALVVLIHPDAQGAAYVLEILATLSIIVSFVSARRYDWQGKWLEYRYLAERLRLVDRVPQAAAVLLSGRRRRTDLTQSWSDMVIDRAARQALDIAVLTGADANRAFDEALLDLTDDQISYNHKTIHRLSRMETRLGLTGLSLFVLSMLLALSALTLKSLTPELMEQIRPYLAGSLAFFPALGAALFGIRVQLNFKAESVRAKDVLNRLEALRDEMQQDQAFTLTRNSRYAWRLVEILKGDLELWRNEQIARAIDLP